MRQRRGVALVQALVIVAAIAAVAVALLARGEQSRARLELRGAGDQAALWLDSGARLIVEMLAALPAGAVHLRQDWARPCDGVRIGAAVLAWEIDDLQGRFNVNTLYGAEPQHEAARAAFLRLAAGQGVPAPLAARLADSLGQDPERRAEAAGGVAIPWPLADARQLAGVAGAQIRDLLPLLAALPVASALNINTARPEVLRALAPQVPEAAWRVILNERARAPVTSIEALTAWIAARLGAEVAAQVAALQTGVDSGWFAARVTLRLDSLWLRRSVLINRDAAEGQGAILMSIPEPEG